MDWNQHQKEWPHLRQCDFPTPAKDGLVDLLIGIDNPELHFSIIDFQGPQGGPVARRGPLGWTCIGPPMKSGESAVRSHTLRTLCIRGTSASTSIPACCNLDQTLRNFWEIESAGTEIQPRILSQEEKEALEKVKKSLVKVEGRYQVGVPWRGERPKMPDNRVMAISRLRSTEKNLMKNSIIAKEYQNVIDSYLEKGYLRKIEPTKEPPAGWYLLHFPVVRMDKSTTKVRIVFDCAAEYEGVSLNSAIHAGPKLQKDLFDVLVRFRRNPVAIACDIQEMYLQVGIQKADRPYFRMLWRNLDPHLEPKEYEFNRVVFGKNSAPLEAQYVAQENARQHQDTYPLAAETVLKSTYMDDSIDSVECDEDGVQLYRELKELWGKASMKARKWVSNFPAVIAAIPEEDRAREITINDGQNPTIKTLGIAWNSQDDVFTIQVTDSRRLHLTKRNVLRKIATVFDPLGFISPFIVIAKILLQELWSRGYGWDEEVKDEISQRIEEWFDQLRTLVMVKIPRCLRQAEPVKSKEVITFVDASQEAYGAAVYIRHTYENQAVSCRLVACIEVQSGTPHSNNDTEIRACGSCPRTAIDTIHHCSSGNSDTDGNVLFR